MADIKNKKGLIRVVKTEYRGKFYVDIRKYYQDNDSGEWKPTPKGISVPYELKDKVIEALNSLP